MPTIFLVFSPQKYSPEFYIHRMHIAHAVVIIMMMIISSNLGNKYDHTVSMYILSFFFKLIESTTPAELNAFCFQKPFKLTWFINVIKFIVVLVNSL